MNNLTEIQTEMYQNAGIVPCPRCRKGQFHADLTLSSGNSQFSWYHGPELPDNTEKTRVCMCNMQQSVKMQVFPFEDIFHMIQVGEF